MSDFSDLFDKIPELIESNSSHPVDHIKVPQKKKLCTPYGLFILLNIVKTPKKLLQKAT